MTMKTPRLSVEQISAIMEIAQTRIGKMTCERSFIYGDTLVVKLVKTDEPAEYRAWDKRAGCFEIIDSIHFESQSRKIWVDSHLARLS